MRQCGLFVAQYAVAPVRAVLVKVYGGSRTRAKAISKEFWQIAQDLGSRSTGSRSRGLARGLRDGRRDTEVGSPLEACVETIERLLAPFNEHGVGLEAPRRGGRGREGWDILASVRGAGGVVAESSFQCDFAAHITIKVNKSFVQVKESVLLTWF